MSDDWESVTVIGQRAHNTRATVAKSNSAINSARRAGGVVSVEKKFSAGGNKAHISTEGQKLTKIDRENEVAPPPKVDLSVGKAIMKGRQDKGFTQKDLATKINEKQNIVNDYEAGRAIPNQQILLKMERTLGIKLRGKDIGSPLGPKKK